jgi:hypothetical protein
MLMSLKSNGMSLFMRSQIKFHFFVVNNMTACQRYWLLWWLLLFKVRVGVGYAADETYVTADGGAVSYLE